MAMNPIFSSPESNNERFVVACTSKKDKINLWHILDGHEKLYFFKANKKYNWKSRWSDDFCQELIAELQSSNPQVKVLRYVVDGVEIFAEKSVAGSKVPDGPKIKPPTPAPYFLIGTHQPDSGRELAWRLYPEVLERDSISPGDLVLVNTQYGRTIVTVVRIEEAAGREQPLRRVVRKMPPREKK